MKSTLNKKVLLIGTSFAASPLAYYIKTLGYQVVVCGNIPFDPCISWADEYYNLDYSNIQSIIELVKEKKFYAICPSINDVSYISGSIIAEKFGYPGFDNPETTETLLNKIKFRELAQKYGFPIPKVFNKHDLTISLKKEDLPIIVKPVDSYSGRGITKIQDLKEIDEAIENSLKYSKSRKIIIEKFINGTLHSHSAFFQKGQIVLDFFVDEFCTVYPYQVDCSNYPSRIKKSIRKKVRECITELYKLLKLTDGLLHTQFMIQGENVYIIECTRRCPGDLYYYLINFSTKMPYVENYLHPFLYLDINFPKNKIEIPYARHTISVAEDSIVYGFSHNIPSKEVKIFPIRGSGILVRKAPLDRIAIIIARLKDKNTLFKITPNLREFIRVERKLLMDM